MLRRFALLLPLLALPLAGCTGPRPSFEITSVTLAERTDDGFVLDFEVQGANRGDEPLPLRTVNYTVNLEQGARFRAVRSPEATLPRRGDQSFTLPAAFKWTDLTPRDIDGVPIDESGEAPAILPEEIRYALRARVTYQATNRIAKLLFDAGVRRPSAFFSESGRLLFGEDVQLGQDVPLPMEDDPQEDVQPERP